MRQVVEGNLDSLIQWLGIETQGQPLALPSTFMAATRTVDLLARLGPRRLLHAEYVHTPESDLAIRMLGYRAMIMERYPESRLTQIAVVLKDGTTPSCDDPENGFTLGYRSIYLREQPVEPLLRVALASTHGPGLAALAPLTAGDHDARSRALRAAWETIQSSPSAQTAAMLEAAAVLATIRLDPHTIDLIRKETGMTIETIADFYSQTEIGRELINRGINRGIDRGTEQSLVRTLSALLRQRFGSQAEIQTLAEQLGHTHSPEAAVALIASVESIEELRSRVSAPPE